jgi:hypothetical protein
MLKTALTMMLLIPYAISMGSNPASATNMFDPGPLENCGTANCGARTIGGTVLLSSSYAVPWVAEIAVGQGECLRVDITAQAVDLEAVLIAPNVAVHRNDNRAAGNLRPLIKLNNAPRSGWYTLQISQASGLPVNTDFTLAFGRYVTNNVANCLPATPSF